MLSSYFRTTPKLEKAGDAPRFLVLIYLRVSGNVECSLFCTIESIQGKRFHIIYSPEQFHSTKRQQPYLCRPGRGQGLPIIAHAAMLLHSHQQPRSEPHTQAKG